MEEAAALGNYVPLSFESPKEQEYSAFLRDAFDINYTHGKYQFAFLACHMRTMRCVHFNIWQIRQTEPGDFAKGVIGFGKDVEKNLLEATSPFVSSAVNERTIPRFLGLSAPPTTAGSTPTPNWWTTETSPPTPTATSSSAPGQRSIRRSPRTCGWGTRSSGCKSSFIQF